MNATTTPPLEHKDMTPQQKKAWEALENAVSAGNKKALRALLKTSDGMAAAAGCDSDNATSVLFYAFLLKKPDLVLELIPFSSLNARGMFKRTPLMMAANAQDPILVSALLSEPAAQETVDWQDETGGTALEMWVSADEKTLRVFSPKDKIHDPVAKREAFDALLEKSDASVRAHFGHTALMNAASENNAEYVTALLRKSDPKAVDSEGNDALKLAINHRAMDAVRALVSVSDLWKRNTSNGETAFDLAAVHAQRDCVELLMPYALPALAAWQKVDEKAKTFTPEKWLRRWFDTAWSWERWAVGDLIAAHAESAGHGFPDLKKLAKNFDREDLPRIHAILEARELSKAASQEKAPGAASNDDLLAPPAPEKKARRSRKAL